MSHLRLQPPHTAHGGGGATPSPYNIRAYSAIVHAKLLERLEKADQEKEREKKKNAAALHLKAENVPSLIATSLEIAFAEVKRPESRKKSALEGLEILITSSARFDDEEERDKALFILRCVGPEMVETAIALQAGAYHLTEPQPPLQQQQVPAADKKRGPHKKKRKATPAGCCACCCVLEDD